MGAATWGGFLYLHLTPDGAVPLADQLGPVPERLRRYPLEALTVGRRLAYRVRANWKLVAENYNECYHCAGVHPELCRVVPAFKRGGAGLDWDRGVPHRQGAWTSTATGRSDRAPFPGLDDDERTRLRAAAGAHDHTATCLYTLTPDRDLVLGPLLGHDRVLVALGAAHGFKFAPLIGRVLADLALHGGTDVDLAPFAPTARPS